MRTWLFRLTAIALLLGLPPALRTERAWACVCYGTPTLEDEASNSTAIFSGRVVSISAMELEHGEDVTSMGVIEIEVYRVWKGPLHATTYIFDHNWNTSCNLPFERGEEYLVFAGTFHPDFGYPESILGGSFCDRTMPLRYGQEDIEALGEGQAPEPGTVAPLPDEFREPEPAETSQAVAEAASPESEAEPQTTPAVETPVAERAGGSAVPPWAIALLAAAAVALAGLGFAAVRRRARDG